MNIPAPPVLPVRARTADHHRNVSIPNIPRVRFRAFSKSKPVDGVVLSNAPDHITSSAQAEVQALLAKLHLLETQNLTLRSRCANLERELSRVAQSIGGSPSALRPPRPALHRCQPRPGDIPAPLRFSRRGGDRRGQPGHRVSNTTDRSLRRSEVNSISDLLESYMTFGSGPNVNGKTSERQGSPTSPNFSRPIPMR